MQKKYEILQVKVPIKLLRLMEETNYFGKTKDEFLTDCIRSGCSCFMTALNFDLMQKLERQFKVKNEMFVSPVVDSIIDRD